MTIYINGKFLVQRLTGVQRYAKEITKALMQTGISFKVLVPGSTDLATIDLPEELLVPVGNMKNTIIWEQFYLPQYLKNKKDDVLLSLCNIGPLLAENQVICVHDVAFMVNPSWFSKSFAQFYRLMIPRLVKKARHVLTVSMFSKKEISRYFEINESRISVLYNAPSSTFVLPSAQDLVLKKEGFFLCVGSLDPRKNLKLLLQLFSLDEFKQQRLIVVGAKSKSFNDLKETLPPNVELRENCGDEELAWLYQHARALINASFYEGFGLPVVEAMASGCPLILSNIDAFVEVAGNRATYFDPRSLASLQDAMSSFFKKEKKELEEELFQNYGRSLSFSWKHSAQQLINKLSDLRYSETKSKIGSAG